MNYLIDNSGWFDEGGYCQVYPVFKKRGIAFKEFHTKQKAEYAYKTQKKLAKFDLAPKVYSSVCKLKFAPDEDYWVPDSSDWGYVTERAKVPNCESKKNRYVILRKIQKLVNEIYEKTGLKFWDCHYSNIGWITRDNRQVLVCVDTGKESFDGFANAWGTNFPGPKCGYCNKYQCRCSEV